MLQIIWLFSYLKGLFLLRVNTSEELFSPILSELEVTICDFQI